MGPRLSWTTISCIMRVRLFLLLLYTPFDIDKYIDYELGRLIACLGDEAGARKHFELVLSGTRPFPLVLRFSDCSVGKYLEVGPSGRKVGSALHFDSYLLTHLLRRDDIVWRYITSLRSDILTLTHPLSRTRSICGPTQPWRRCTRTDCRLNPYPCHRTVMSGWRPILNDYLIPLLFSLQTKLDTRGFSTG